jgi:hypothetical protein
MKPSLTLRKGVSTSGEAKPDNLGFDLHFKVLAQIYRNNNGILIAFWQKL